MRNLPRWVPGTGFQDTAKQWRVELDGLVEKPYAFVKQQLDRGINNGSYLSRLIETSDDTAQAQFLNKWSCISLYGAGSDTTVASLAWFFLAMTLHPDKQSAAQDEIDRVVGQDRLPTAKDRENLPYVEALIKEVFRWHPIGPMGLPHMSTEDDIFEGYRIPKGAILFPNVW